MRHTVLFTLLILLISVACDRKPKYDEVPEISFNEDRTQIHRRVFSTVSASYSDSVKFAINFTDGDGDLGLDETDRLDASNINFVMVEQRKFAGEWSDNLKYEEQFQLLSSKDLNGPVDGILFNIKQFQELDYLENDTLRFLISIKDRAGHWSNTLQTPEFIINKQ